MTLLEVCCYSMECALEAQRRGADRIELCAAPQEGGLTPSLGVLKSVREAVTIPVHPIIRPRGGDFCYTAGEFAAMLDDVAAVKDLGFSGLVIGILERILTSGQQASAEKGISLIRELISQSDTPIIMAGAGVRAANLALFLQAGIKEVHTSAGQWLPSPMRFRNPGLSMSTDAEADEYLRYAVNGEAVAEMKKIITA